MRLTGILVFGAIMVAIIIVIVMTTSGPRRDGYKLLADETNTGGFQFRPDVELRGDTRFYVNAGGASHYSPISNPKFSKGQVIIGTCLSNNDKLVYKSTLMKEANKSKQDVQAQLLQLEAESARADKMIRELEEVKRQIADKSGTLRVTAGGASHYLESKFGEFGDPLCVRPDGRVYGAVVKPGGLATADASVFKALGSKGKKKTSSLDLT